MYGSFQLVYYFIYLRDVYLLSTMFQLQRTQWQARWTWPCLHRTFRKHGYASIRRMAWSPFLSGFPRTAPHTSFHAWANSSTNSGTCNLMNCLAIDLLSIDFLSVIKTLLSAALNHQMSLMAPHCILLQNDAAPYMRIETS